MSSTTKLSRHCSGSAEIICEGNIIRHIGAVLPQALNPDSLKPVVPHGVLPVDVETPCHISELGHGVFRIDPEVDPASTRCVINMPLPGVLQQGFGFSGRWSHELIRRDFSVASGWSRRNHAGARTSHNAFPAVVLHAQDADDDHGEALSVHLGWFGDYELSIDERPDGQSVLQWSIPALALRRMAEAPVFPPVYLAWSNTGLNGLRAANQDAARDMRRKTGAAPAPRVQFNSWEGTYFNHDPKVLAAQAQIAARLGCERFVLDDGWFGERSDDTKGLGDWFPRKEVYPEGLGPLIDEVIEAGLEFGLWVEPEMVNADSDVYRQHPDWILGDSDQTLGRNQFGLDLTIPECRDHLERLLSEIVADHRISSLKWDMNRDLPYGDNRALAPAAVDLIQHVLAARPDLDIEACASGGGRADWSALAWCNRVWISDNHDPDIRTGIVENYSLFAPAEVIGTHVGARVSHQTGRTFDLHARAGMATLGSMGLELDLTALDVQEQEILSAYIALHKRNRDWMADGHLLKLTVTDPQLQIMGVFSKDRRSALVFCLQGADRAGATPQPARIPHLTGRVRVSAPVQDRALRRTAQTRPQWLDGGEEFDAELLAGYGLPMPALAPMRSVLVEIGPA